MIIYRNHAKNHKSRGSAVVHIFRCGSEPCEEKKAAKLAEYKRMRNACS